MCQALVKSAVLRVEIVFMCADLLPERPASRRAGLEFIKSGVDTWAPASGSDASVPNRQLLQRLSCGSIATRSGVSCRT